MIFVTLGTQDKPFPRILRMVEEQVVGGAITEPVIAQTGHTTWSSHGIQVVGFMPPPEMARLVSECRVMISHGGAGTLMSAIASGKTIIAVPRLARLGEHVNDHQIEIVTHLAAAGHLIDCSSGDLRACLNQASDFVPSEYHHRPSRVAEVIERFIG